MVRKTLLASSGMDTCESVLARHAVAARLPASGGAADDGEGGHVVERAAPEAQRHVDEAIPVARGVLQRGAGLGQRPVRHVLARGCGGPWRLRSGRSGRERGDRDGCGGGSRCCRDGSGRGDRRGPRRGHREAGLRLRAARRWNRGRRVAEDEELRLLRNRSGPGVCGKPGCVMGARCCCAAAAGALGGAAGGAALAAGGGGGCAGGAAGACGPGMLRRSGSRE